MKIQSRDTVGEVATKKCTEDFESDHAILSSPGREERPSKTEANWKALICIIEVSYVQEIVRFLGMDWGTSVKHVALFATAYLWGSHPLPVLSGFPGLSGVVCLAHITVKAGHQG